MWKGITYCMSLPYLPSQALCIGQTRSVRCYNRGCTWNIDGTQLYGLLTLAVSEESVKNDGIISVLGLVHFQKCNQINKHQNYFESLLGWSHNYSASLFVWVHKMGQPCDLFHEKKKKVIFEFSPSQLPLHSVMYKRIFLTHPTIYSPVSKLQII